MTVANAEDIVVVRAAARDQHGDPIGEPSEHVLPGCVVAPLFSTESYQDGDRVLARYNVFVRDADADVRATDRLRRPSDPTPAGASPRERAPWQVIGDAQQWRSAFSTWQPGLVLTIERNTG